MGLNIMWEEIQSEVQKLKTGENDLKKFGITMAVVLGILTAIGWYRDSGAFPYVLALTIVFLAAGLMFPMLLKKVYVAWMTLALVLGFFMTKVILSLLFYTAFTVIGIISRMVKKDPLDQQFTPNATTYWKPYQAPEDFKKHLERQF